MLIWYFFNNMDVNDCVGKLPEQHFSVWLLSNPGHNVLFLLKLIEARISEWNIFNLQIFKCFFFSSMYPFKIYLISYFLISSFNFLHLKICELFSNSPHSQFSIIPLFAPRSFVRHLNANSSGWSSMDLLWIGTQRHLAAISGGGYCRRRPLNWVSDSWRNSLLLSFPTWYVFFY